MKIPQNRAASTRYLTESGENEKPFSNKVQKINLVTTTDELQDCTGGNKEATISGQSILALKELKNTRPQLHGSQKLIGNDPIDNRYVRDGSTDSSEGLDPRELASSCKI